jgi:hypothetical protein
MLKETWVFFVSKWFSLGVIANSDPLQVLNHNSIFCKFDKITFENKMIDFENKYLLVVSIHYIYLIVQFNLQ